VNDLVYLDNNATTPLDERVLEAMLPALRHTGNATSAHGPGRWAQQAVNTARARRANGQTPTQIAKALGVSRASIYRHINLT